ncbi:MAG: SAM-dependent methyltransferase [Desulfobacterales bacterium]|nr:SAM-dependent methyltransferase [Desulfobacterales bacterium]
MNWEQLSLGSGTLVFYMGMKNLPQIAANLIAHGRTSQTPVALVRWGTRPEQDVLTGTLADIAEKAQRKVSRHRLLSSWERWCVCETSFAGSTPGPCSAREFSLPGQPIRRETFPSPRGARCACAGMSDHCRYPAGKFRGPGPGAS